MIFGDLRRLAVSGLLLLCAGGLCGCNGVRELDEKSVSSTEQAVIYGDDTRLDVYEYDASLAQRRALSSVVGLAWKEDITLEDGVVSQVSASAGVAFDLCPEERFFE